MVEGGSFSGSRARSRAGSRAGSANAYPPSKWERHVIFDLVPFLTCCLSTSNDNQCSEYYTKRPSTDCTGYEEYRRG